MTLRFLLAASLVALCSCASSLGAQTSSLLDTKHSAEPAPKVFRVRFETSRGPFVIEAHRAWSPWGVDRFYYLVRRNFYDDTRFFRVIKGFVVQFGMSGDPTISSVWKWRYMPDDTVAHQSNLRGRVSFGSLGPNTRTTQLFIDYRDNLNLDRDYAPIGQVVEGMNVLDSLWSGDANAPQRGIAADQDSIVARGNAYLTKEFPKLDYIKTARLVK